jgi:hypothetical protein
MKHWIEYLPEVGSLSIEARRQESLVYDIVHHTQVAKKLKSDYDANEKRLMEIALQYWSKDEIKQAKKTGIREGR